jgi:cysteine desulfurase/selenocysteine lyase
MKDISQVRSQFPQLKNQVYGKSLIYFDSAATSYKTQGVIDKTIHYYKDLSVNVHRAIHPLAEQATQEYEQTRTDIKTWINAQSTEEIIFTRGTTESINLVSHILEESMKPGDEIILTISEHHSNLVPWQILSQKTKAVLKFITLTSQGKIDLEQAQKQFSSKTKIVAFPYISNVLGFINPVHEIIALAKKHQAYTLIDAAQAASRLPIDVQNLEVDFLAFSGHKCFGPTSFGVLYGKKDLLEKLPPFMGGGDMIENVELTHTDYNKLPFKYEAGTPNIAAVIAFKAALDFMQDLKIENIYHHEMELTHYLYQKLKTIPDINIIGDAPGKLGLVSFTLPGIHTQDMATFLGKRGFALRSGHLCAQPLLKHYQVPSVLRASISVYNTVEEIDALLENLQQIIKILRD